MFFIFHETSKINMHKIIFYMVMTVEDHIFEGKLKEFEQVFIDYSTATGRAKSASPTMQLILSYLAIHKKLTQKQLKDLTSLSLATISKNLRELMGFGIISKQRKEGKNEYYYVLAEMNQLVGRMGNITSGEFVEMIDFFKLKLAELEKYKGKPGQKLLSERLNDLIGTIQTVINVSSKLMKMLIPKTK